jgi:flagellar hook protein FlgE
MYSGISGLKNFQTKLDVIGNNIANVNTAGFKKGRVTFKDAMSQTIAGASAATENRGGKNSMQVGLGSTLASIDTIHDGSSIQTTNRAQDLAIQGDGYFVVKSGNAEYYTRAGNLYLDDSGTLVTADGFKVQAYKYAADGQTLTNTYGDVAINVNAVMPATSTTKITFSENLAANAVGPDSTNPDIKGTVFTQQIKVIDNTGQSHVVDVHFKKTGTDAWDVFIGKDPNGVDSSGSAIAPDHSLTFVNGKIDPASAVIAAKEITVVNDNADTTSVDESVKVTVDLDFTNLTQFEGTTTAIADPDGSTEGKLESFSIGSAGEISGVYSNGEISKLGRLAIAKFSNTAGLSKAGGNTFQETISSGVANIGAAGDGRGTVASGALEMSNVDLSEEFTEMITAQRGFQANTRIITTSDEILQELVNLKR